MASADLVSFFRSRFVSFWRMLDLTSTLFFFFCFFAELNKNNLQNLLSNNTFSLFDFTLLQKITCIIILLVYTMMMMMMTFHFFVCVLLLLWFSFQVYLYGGHVTSWKNDHGEELLFLSSKVCLCVCVWCQTCFYVISHCIISMSFVMLQS